jgi:hypothetical protein
VFELIRGLEFEAIVSLDFLAEVDKNAIREIHLTRICKFDIADTTHCSAICYFSTKCYEIAAISTVA